MMWGVRERIQKMIETSSFPRLGLDFCVCVCVYIYIYIYISTDVGK